MPLIAALWKQNLIEHERVLHAVEALGGCIDKAALAIFNTVRGAGKVMLCGNGGSAADAQHIAAEFTGRFIEDRRPLAALALHTDTSALTCISNDYSFADVFARQLQALGRAGDALVAISTSGNSPNVLRAAQAVRAMGISVVGLLGRDGGAIKPLCDVAIVVPSASTARPTLIRVLWQGCLVKKERRNLGLYRPMMYCRIEDSFRVLEEKRAIVNEFMERVFMTWSRHNR